MKTGEKRLLAHEWHEGRPGKQLTNQGEKIASDLAQLHGFSAAAMTQMMYAVLNRNACAPVGVSSSFSFSSRANKLK